MINYFIVQYGLLVRLLLKMWHLSVFGNKIAYNTSLFAFKSIATARGGTGD